MVVVWRGSKEHCWVSVPTSTRKHVEEGVVPRACVGSSDVCGISSNLKSTDLTVSVDICVAPALSTAVGACNQIIKH